MCVAHISKTARDLIGYLATLTPSSFDWFADKQLQPSLRFFVDRVDCRLCPDIHLVYFLRKVCILNFAPSRLHYRRWYSPWHSMACSPLCLALLVWLYPPSIPAGVVTLFLWWLWTQSSLFHQPNAPAILLETRFFSFFRLSRRRWRDFVFYCLSIIILRSRVS